MGSAQHAAHFYSYRDVQNVRVLYVIAMYGPEYLGNLIHRELGQEFIRHGHPFDVFALASAREMSGRQVDMGEAGIRVHRAIAAGSAPSDALNAAARPLLHYDRFGAGLVALTRFLSARPRYDAILAEGAYPFGALCALAGAGDNLIPTVAGGDFIDSRATRYGYGRFRTARALMRFAFRRAGAVRVTTPLVRERVLALGAPAERVVLIPRNIASYCYPPANVPLDEFRAAARQSIAAKYGSSAGRLIVAAGRLLPIKGFDQLIGALPLMGDSSTRLLIAGPNRTDTELGDYQVYLMNLAREQGVSQQICFAGAVPHQEMRELLAAADLLVVPSVLEGMNKVAVEAAVVGTPSVVTRTAGVADDLEAAEAGKIVPDNAPQTLARGIRELLADSALYAHYRANGLALGDRYTSARVGAALIALCEKVAAHKW